MFYQLLQAITRFHSKVLKHRNSTQWFLKMTFQGVGGLLAPMADVLVSQIPGSGSYDVTLTHTFATCDLTTVPSDLLPPEVPLTYTWTVASDMFEVHWMFCFYETIVCSYLFGAMLFYAQQKSLPVLLPEQEHITLPSGASCQDVQPHPDVSLYLRLQHKRAPARLA